MRCYNLFLLLLSLSFIQKISNLQCGEEQIDHCAECATGKDANTCAKCEDNFFNFLFNYLCLPCDHKVYGDPGCQGNCQMDDTIGFICDEFGCKDGFYSLDKMSCMNCNSLSSPNCAKCSYLPPAGKTAQETDQRIFECQECLNNQYALYPDGRCHHCHRPPNCAECHYQENTLKSICDRCYYDYYLRGEDCVKCRHYPIYGGYCRQCTDDVTDYDNIFCYCNRTYTFNTSRTCDKCPSNCEECYYDQNLLRTRCNRCFSRYTLNAQGTCTFCGRGCEYCSLDINDKPRCSFCQSGYDLIDGKCLKCPPYCKKCHLDESLDEFICDECFSYSAMDSKKECHICPENCIACEFNQRGELKCTSCYKKYYSRYSYDQSNNYFYELDAQSICRECPDQCLDCFWKESKNDFVCRNCYYGYALKDDDCLECSTISELGPGCESCSYGTDNKFLCHSCINRNYAESTNTYECIDNTDSNNKQLFGCLRAIYNSATREYECYICKPEFIPILNEHRCLPPEMADLHSDCREANNIGTKSNPIFSCLSCKNYLLNTNVTDHRGADDCYVSDEELILCQKATKDETGKLQCNKCKGNFEFIFSDTYNRNICNKKCKQNSFNKNFWCYACDDKYFGNPGCLEEKGCEYISDNDQLNCNECNVGYFQYTYGQCFQCKEIDKYCKECHFNETANRFECEKCIDGYLVNENKRCQIITCDEYPEVMPGCVICSDKLNQYKSEGKCQACKEGFYKTKEGTCVHCKAKKNGGPGCQLCDYGKDEEGNDINKIVCKHCPEGFLTSDGKCYRCRDELENGCRNCTLKVNEIDQTEKLVCTQCQNEQDYILSNNSHCIHKNSYLEKIPFCSRPINNIEKYIITDNTTSSNNEENGEENYPNNGNNNTKNYTYGYRFSSWCEICKEGYARINGTCYPFEISNCSLDYIFSLNSGSYEENENDYYSSYNELERTLSQCRSMCYGSKYVDIDFYYETTEQVKVYYEINNTDENMDNINNNTHNNQQREMDQKEKGSYKTAKKDILKRKLEGNEEDNDDEKKEVIEVMETRTIGHTIDIYNYLGKDNSDSFTNNSHIMNIIAKSYLCLDNLGKGDKFSPENLRKCYRAYYIENNDTYQCISCMDGYSLDEESKTCKQSIKVSMNLRPGFDNCYMTNIGNYSNPIYSCYHCNFQNNLLVTSDTGAKFCTEKKGELAGCSEVYADTTYLNNNYNCTFCDVGYISYYNIFFEKIICQDIHYKPDKIREIDSTIFDPDEVEHVEADEKGLCENGKLFTPDGKNCYACNNRTVGMAGCKGTCEFNLKRNISLKCEEGMCKTGYIEKAKGVCEPCETINEGCIECHYEDEYISGYLGFKRKRRFSCDQCDNSYLRSEDGTCHHCSTLGFNNCKNCGIDAGHDNELVCLECRPGFFINEEGKCISCYEDQMKGKDNRCIKCDDVENGGFEGCETCHNVNNEPQCTYCYEGFILLENNHTCLRISSNAALEELPHCEMAFLNNNNHFECKKCSKGFVLLKENNQVKCFNTDFIPAKNPYLCQIYENLGTEDRPKFSCVSCESSQNEEKYEDQMYTRITYQNNNTAFCEYRHKNNSLENCTEAEMIVDNNNIKLNCLKCIEDNIIYHHNDSDYHICRYKYYEKECVVKYCKTCVLGNNYFCSQCLPADYEVNPLTGGCLLKLEKTPAVYFKDIFRLKFNQYKQIGGRLLYGPFLSFRGLTNSQINTGHAFLILLSFKLHYARTNRYLEEEKIVETYCLINENQDETDGDPNLVDFDCIGDTEEEESFVDYKLSSIKESTDNNTGMLEGSNLDELAEETDLANLDKKEKTTFELKNFVDLAVFLPDNVSNITSKDYHFDLNLNGKLNKNFSQQSLDVQIPLNPIKDKKVECNFNILEDQNAVLKCDIELEEYKDNFSEFYFKVTEIKDSNEKSIYLSRINEVRFIHEEQE